MIWNLLVGSKSKDPSSISLCKHMHENASFCGQTSGAIPLHKYSMRKEEKAKESCLCIDLITFPWSTSIILSLTVNNSVYLTMYFGFRWAA